MVSLNSIGISDLEYSIYKSLLINPKDNISDLAKTIGITRATLYKVLDSLEEKGLINKIKSKTKTLFKAENPEILLNFIEKYKTEADNSFNLLKKQIPLLKVLAGDNKNLDNSDILIYRGENALDELDNLILTENKQVYGYTYDYHVEACFKFNKDYTLEHNSYLDVVLKCGDKFVFPGNKESIKTVKKIFEKNPFLKNKWEPRWIDSTKFKMKINFYCFGDKIAFSLGSYKQKVFLAYVIHNKDISDSMANLSIFLWSIANPI